MSSVRRNSQTVLWAPGGRQLAAAFRGGILVLLAAPFSLVAVIATLVVRMSARRHDLERRVELERQEGLGRDLD